VLLQRGDVVTASFATDAFEAVAGDTCVIEFGPFGTDLCCSVDSLVLEPPLRCA
jgi:2-keto-4-pentenoate hydratase